jgi:dienelactone hydrolase
MMRVVFAGLVIVAAAGSLLAQQPAAEIARTAAIEFAEGRFSDLYARFDQKMKAAVTEPMLRQVVAPQITGAAGTFERAEGETLCHPASGLQSCVTPLLFQQARLSLRIAVNPQGQVVGLFVAGMEPRAGSGLTIVNGNVRLPAVLTLPEGRGPHPVIVLVHGSGEHDPDETIGPNKPFRDLAEGLAKRGVGTLRYFKRGRLTPLGPAATLEDEVTDDALAAVDLARRLEGVDPARVFVLGHSLGGYLAPYIASRNSRLRGIVLLAGGNRPMRDTVMDQVRHLTGSEESFESVWNALPPRYQTGLADYDPIAVAQSLTIPMLVLQGGRDYQVTVRDYDRWQAALEGRPNVSLKLYPRLNHLFHEGDARSQPAEYLVQGRMADVVIDDIARWAAEATVRSAR